jgi:4a-hydroxytetrahydrobiopterin dehydratase
MPKISREALSRDEIERRTVELDGWSVRDGRLHREFEFASFAEAFGFMTSVAIHAQEMNHHPDWFNSYTKLVVDLMSHDVNGLSDRDFRLAAVMDSLYSGARSHGGAGPG